MPNECAEMSHAVLCLQTLHKHIALSLPPLTCGLQPRVEHALNLADPRLIILVLHKVHRLETLLPIS